MTAYATDEEFLAEHLAVHCCNNVMRIETNLAEAVVTVEHASDCIRAGVLLGDHERLVLVHVRPEVPA